MKKLTQAFMETQWRLLVAMFLAQLLFLSACATAQPRVDHAFGFDTRLESPGVEVLDYQYGTSNQTGTRAPDWVVKEGRVSGGTNINGPMLRGEYLRVKWREKQSGEVREETVDLRNRLPGNITDHRIHFVIRGTNLYVYAISPEKVPGLCPADTRDAARTGTPEDRIFRMYCDLKIIQIYPDQSKP